MGQLTKDEVIAAVTSGKSFPGLDLRNINLAGCDLAGANLESADLTGADLRLEPARREPRRRELRARELSKRRPPRSRGRTGEFPRGRLHGRRPQTPDLRVGEPQPGKLLRGEPLSRAAPRPRSRRLQFRAGESRRLGPLVVHPEEREPPGRAARQHGLQAVRPRRLGFPRSDPPHDAVRGDEPRRRRLARRPLPRLQLRRHKPRGRQPGGRLPRGSAFQPHRHGGGRPERRELGAGLPRGHGPVARRFSRLRLHAGQPGRYEPAGERTWPRQTSAAPTSAAPT